MNRDEGKKVVECMNKQVGGENQGSARAVLRSDKSKLQGIPLRAVAAQP